jgi:hypothetical protein
LEEKYEKGNRKKRGKCERKIKEGKKERKGKEKEKWEVKR